MGKGIGMGNGSGKERKIWKGKKGVNGRVFYFHQEVLIGGTPVGKKKSG